MRITVVAVALAVAAAGCGDDDAATSSVATTTTGGSTTTTQGETTPSQPPTSTSGAVGPTDCTEIWPESLVHEVAGAGMDFVAANADASACTYLGDSAGIALAWRASTRADFDSGRTTAGLAGETTDHDVCDAAYSLDLGGAVLIMEAFSEALGRTLTATVSGADPDDARSWAETLLAAAC